MRIRISYKKNLPLRFTSALDIQSIWERTIRRDGLPLAYSRGFHPKPKIQLGLPLPLGFISDDEKVDIWLEKDIKINNHANNLQLKLPDGLMIKRIEEIMEKEKPLVTKLVSSEYLIKLWDQSLLGNNYHALIASILKKENIIRTKRNGKKYNLRPLIYDLRNDVCEPGKSDYSLYMKLASAQNRMGRADEVMFALGFSLDEFLVLRLRSNSYE